MDVVDEMWVAFNGNSIGDMRIALAHGVYEIRRLRLGLQQIDDKVDELCKKNGIYPIPSGATRPDDR